MAQATRTRVTLLAIAAGAAVVLASCSANDDDGTSGEDAHDHHSDHSEMDHPADGGPPPEGITEAAHPTYPVGSEVVLNADHMSGMDGAPATVVGAYDTYTYAVDYTPTEGGDLVEEHKWVVHEELEDPGAQRLPDGAEATLLAEHMSGMAGAEATIAFSTDETVYIVDFEADGMAMTNHKWVVESEIEPGP